MTTNHISIDDITLNIMKSREKQEQASFDDFLNISKLPDGDFVFRILGPIKSCWEVWNKDPSGKSTKTVFHPEEGEAALRCAQDQKPLFTFFFQAYCVKEKALKIITVKQASLQKELIALVKGAKEGLEMSTCVITKKTGDKFPSYTLSQATTMSPEGVPVPYRSPPSKEVQDLIKTTYCDLNAIYERKAPFCRVHEEFSR